MAILNFTSGTRLNCHQLGIRHLYRDWTTAFEAGSHRNKRTFTLHGFLTTGYFYLLKKGSRGRVVNLKIRVNQVRLD